MPEDLIVVRNCALIERVRSRIADQRTDITQLLAALPLV